MSPDEPTQSAEDWLAQLLGEGRDLKDQATDGAPELADHAKALGRRGEDTLIDRFGMEDTPETRETIRRQTKYVGVAGALALLLKSRSTRKLAALGGLGALGLIAYRGYKRGEMPADFRDAIGLLTGEPAEKRANVLIKAMIAAAKADGEISADERALISSHPETDIDKLEKMLAEAIDSKDIAALAETDQMAAEIYAVSCRVADGLNPEERNYLDHLAMALGLDPEDAALIETDIRTGS